MLRSDPEPQRGTLKFAEEAVAAFGFLQAVGFTCVESSVTFVRYESDRSFVNVYHGRSSFEVGVEIGSSEWAPSGPDATAADLAEPFVGYPGSDSRARLWDVLRFLNVPGIATNTFLQASTRESVRTCIQQLAELLSRHARVALDWDEAFWKRFMDWRSEDARRERIKDELVQVREAAGRAWRERAFQAFIDLLAPYAAELSEAERMKVAYAKTHLPVR